MRYLLDTDILSELLRRAPAPLPVRKVAATSPDEQSTSSITLGELLYGSHRLQEQGHHLAERIERTIVANLAILPFDADATREYGRLRAELERTGTPIGDSDTRIAAIALARDLIVVTHNVRHFERVPGLQIENWLA